MTNEAKQESKFNSLTTREKLEVNKFLDEHKELTSSDGRTAFFRETAAEEIIRRNEENATLVAAGKPELTDSQKTLILAMGGVIRYQKRHDDIVKMHKEAEIARNSALLDAAGLGQDRYYS